MLETQKHHQSHVVECKVDGARQLCCDYKCADASPPFLLRLIPPRTLCFSYSPVHPLYDVIQRFSIGERPFKLTWWPVISAGGPHSAPSACQREGDEEKWSGKHEKRLESVPGEARLNPLWTRQHITLKWHQRWTCGQQRSPWTISLKMQTTNPHSRHRSDRVTVIFFCIWHECSPWMCKAGFDILVLTGTAGAVCLNWANTHKTKFSSGMINYIPIFPNTLPVSLPLRVSASSPCFHSPWFD